MSDYRKYPAPGPSRRAVWLLIMVVGVLLLANIAHQAGLT